MERVQKEYAQDFNNLAPEKMTDDKEQLTDRPNEYNWCHMCD
jgi:hypothetical protein